MKKLFLLLLTGILLLTGCNTAVNDETDTTEIPETELTETESAETEAPAPVLTPSGHTITVADAGSILAANEMALSTGGASAYNVCHGGHQMRVVHTERATYAVVAKFFNDTYHGNSEFYFVKVDNEENVTLLYYDEYKSDASTMQLNIGQDANGDVIGTVGSTVDLRTYIFDAETDEVEIHRADAVFSSKSDEKKYTYSPSYSQTMFDFANRKLYQFYVSCYETNEYVLEWFTFDMETKEWTTTSIHQIFPDILGRVNYLYPLPDGNGGAYVMGRTGVNLSLIADEVGYEGSYEGSINGKYAHDTFYLFHIPDLTSAENIEYKVVQEPYREKAREGIWSEVTHEQSGHVFIDADGYLHIIYMFYLYDITGNFPDPDPELQYRHVIFDGMECIYSEKIEQIPSYADPDNSKFMLAQSLDGTLYMMEALTYNGGNPFVPMSIRVFKADDALGKSWTMVSEKTFEDVGCRSISLSEPRGGSTLDNTIAFFVYGNRETGGAKAFTFRLSLDDFSMTEEVDMLGTFGLVNNETRYFPPYYSAHQNQVIHTENGTYSAFVYKYDHKYYDPYYSNLHFCITKTDANGKSTVLYDGVFVGDNEEFLNMCMLSDGKIYVFPPTGDIMYIVNPADDSVTEQAVTLNVNASDSTLLQQVDAVTDAESGKTFVISYNGTGNGWNLDHFRMLTNTIKTEDASFSKRAKMILSNKLDGYYTNLYTFSDGAGGAYVVASKIAYPRYIDGVEYVGRTNTIKDSIVLIHPANLNKNASPEIIEIQAPYTAQGAQGIWSTVNMADYGDAYLDSEGKLHVIYTYHHVDLDDMDGLGNAELKTETFKRYHAVLEGTTVVSTEEIVLDGVSENAAVRMAETTDGTLYLIVCDTDKINVYFESENNWVLTAIKELGEFTAESFSISSPRGGSIQNNVIDCIVYASDKDVYFTSISFE